MCVPLFGLAETAGQFAIAIAALLLDPAARAADLVPSTPSLPTPPAQAAGRMTLPPQLGDDAHDVGLRVPLGQLVEEPQSLGREEFDEVGAVHPATLASRTGDFRALALTLHECQIAPRLGLALSQ